MFYKRSYPYILDSMFLPSSPSSLKSNSLAGEHSGNSEATRREPMNSLALRKQPEMRRLADRVIGFGVKLIQNFGDSEQKIGDLMQSTGVIAVILLRAIDSSSSTDRLLLIFHSIIYLSDLFSDLFMEGTK
ncbi:hypothetical protein E3N88_34890 [Mikania micrantha]|uniref:Uncharacterized protein n=1 Tax=Mikania micrantha TaxID=192012 RepID=A0A5N6LZF3_9ASTR|nr:hypothetical protein E3N88_34890 [Mikania micrantha]